MILLAGAHECAASNWLEGRHRRGETAAHAGGGSAGCPPPKLVVRPFHFIDTLSPPTFQREKLDANERVAALQAHSNVQQQQIRAQLENENVCGCCFLAYFIGSFFFVACWQRREVAVMQEKVVELQREVLRLQEQLNKQREYCSNHHIYDPTSPLMTADVIIQSPAHAADEAAIGLIDLAQQVTLWHKTLQISISPHIHNRADTAQRLRNEIERAHQRRHGQRAEEREGVAGSAADVCAEPFAAARSRSARPFNLHSEGRAFEMPPTGKTCLKLCVKNKRHRQGCGCNTHMPAWV